MVNPRSSLVLLALFAVGCSGSPTAPSAPAPVNPAATTPPVVSAPPVATAPQTPAPNPLLNDSRFSLSFYRMFALGALPDGSFATLRRQDQPPRIYLRTVDDAGASIDAGTLDQTAAALINVAGSLTGVFGLAGLERGTGTREGQGGGWITVRWSDRANGSVCGTGYIGGSLMILYPKTAGCRCSGGPAVNTAVIKHELGHVLGFYHTDSTDDLMFAKVTACDKNPSAREMFHAKIAYSQPNGSLNPS